jgi:hypothetical protein
MKNLIWGTMIPLIALFGLTAGTVLAADLTEIPNNTDPAVIGPYEGVFYGIVTGDNNSNALMALQMTDRNGVVEGKIYLGEGLYIDAGVCGKTEIPSVQQYATGQTLPDNPNEMSVNSTVNVSGFDIGVELHSIVSADGETLTAQASIDLPWICGRDPSFSGTLERVR